MQHIPLIADITFLVNSYFFTLDYQKAGLVGLYHIADISNEYIYMCILCEVGYPKILLPDEGSQLLKSCKEMKFNFKDTKQQLFQNAQVEFYPCPVGGHNMHGRVERKIQEVKKSIAKSFEKERLSILQWETVASQIANCMNDLPLALGDDVSDFEVADLLTPNRLKLGRNNYRSPDGPIMIENDPKNIIKRNKNIFDAWFENWMNCHVPKLMFKPKWYDTSHHLKEGDIVLFLKDDSIVKSKYKFGIVEKTFIDRDGLIRKANVRYHNADENVNRNTNRSVRELVVIHSIDNIDISKSLGEMAIMANAKFQMSH